MRGAPIFRLLLLAGILLLVGIPVLRLTGTPSPGAAPSALPATPPDEPAPRDAFHLRIQSVLPLDSLVLELFGEEILRLEQPATEARVPLALSAAWGEDLVVRAAWEPGMRNALELSLENAQSEKIHETFWGTGELIEVLRIPARDAASPRPQ